MKRLLSMTLIALLLLPFCLSLTACQGGEEETVTLYVYNWGEYISDGTEDTVDVNAEFERWYFDNFHKKVKVNYSTYSSNESMLAKLESGSVSYDVVIPSDYMIARMIEKEMLLPLLENTEYQFRNLGNIDPSFSGGTYDPGNKYSVPYMYGMIGIIYNTTMVDEEDIGSWNLMWDKDPNGEPFKDADGNPVAKYAGNILQFNNPRDAFGTAQYYKKMDVNSKNTAEWEEALALLKDQKPILQGYVMDEIFNKMENGSAAIAAYYAGDFLTMYENNPDLDFFYPSEGTNLYVDAMCIPTTSRNPDVARAYIDFMLSVDPEYGAPAIANAEYTYYASPNKAVLENAEYQEYMNSIYAKCVCEDCGCTGCEIEDGACTNEACTDCTVKGGFDLMYDADAMKTATSYENLDEDQLILLNDLWEELKSDIDVGLTVYIICGVILAVLLGGGLFLAVRKKIRDRY